MKNEANIAKTKPQTYQLIADLQQATIPPMTAKRRLARAIVAEWHGEQAAEEAETEWTRIHSRGEAPTEIPTFELDFQGQETTTVQLATLLAEAGAAPSRAEAKRLIRQGAVELNGQKATEAPTEIREGDTIKVGRRTWLRITRAP